MPKAGKKKSSWRDLSWISTLYFAQGIPYIAVMTISVILYKKMGINNTDIAFYTSWLYLPWVIKPIWSPLVDILKTKRYWILTMQLLIGAGLAGVGLMLPLPDFFRWSLVFFWLLAFSSATHDIAADGFYMLALDEVNQAKYVGIRSTFYRAATIFGQGILIIITGLLEKATGNIPYAWSITFFILAGLFVLFFFYHRVILPKPEKSDLTNAPTYSSVMKGFWETFRSFFMKKQIVVAILFMLFFRLPEALVVKLLNPFLLDPVEVGGLGLSTTQVGLVYGTYGILGLTIGGILGGLVASRGGLRKWLWPMTLSILIPCSLYLFLAIYQPTSIALISFCVVLDQFGYGFGFTAYMLYLMYFSDGESKTAHYAICTGFMALGMMLPGMVAGKLQEMVGYEGFFWAVMICCIPSLIVTALVKIDPAYGTRHKS